MQQVFATQCLPSFSHIHEFDDRFLFCFVNHAAVFSIVAIQINIMLGLTDVCLCQCQVRLGIQLFLSDIRES